MQKITQLKQLLLTTLLFFFPVLAQGKDKVATEQAIVLLHGIGNSGRSFVTMQGALEKAFSTTTVIALNSAAGFNSVTMSIETQADAAFAELQKRLPNLADTAIILVGQSQGGARGYSLLKKYGEQLNIKGLISIGTPWEGAPGARVTETMLQEGLTTSVKRNLQTLSTHMGYTLYALEKNFAINVQQNQSMCLYPGAKDLMLESEFLQDVAQNLSKVDIPILAIAADVTSLAALSTKGGLLAAQLQALDTLYTQFTVADHINRRHDTVVPVYSQHALTIPTHSKYFERYSVSEVFHSEFVLGVPVPQGKYALTNDAIIKKTITFIKNKLGE